MSDQALQRQREEPEPRLRLREVVPAFAVPAADGHVVRLGSYKGRRNLALFFAHSASCPGCRENLRAIADRYGEFLELDAEVLVVVSSTRAAVSAMSSDLGLPFPTLADENGEVSSRYLGVRPGAADSIAGVFVTDRYGALYHQALARADAGLPGLSDTLAWLQFVGIQCEECGMPEWPVAWSIEEGRFM